MKNIQTKIAKQNESITNMFIKPTNLVNIIDPAKTLKRKTSSGFDEISTKLLSEIIEEII